MADLLAYSQQRRWPEDKLPVGLESIRNFNVRAKVVGPSVRQPILISTCFSLLED